LTLLLLQRFYFQVCTVQKELIGTADQKIPLTPSKAHIEIEFAGSSAEPVVAGFCLK
jgi:hypothetical protein